MPCKVQNLLSLIMSFVQITSIPKEQIIHNWENASKVYFPAAFKRGLHRSEAWMEIILGECHVIKRISLGQMCLYFCFQLIRKNIPYLFQFQNPKANKQQKFEQSYRWILSTMFLLCFQAKKVLVCVLYTWSSLIYSIRERICLTEITTTSTLLL